MHKSPFPAFLKNLHQHIYDTITFLSHVQWLAGLALDVFITADSMRLSGKLKSLGGGKGHYILLCTVYER